MSKIKSYLTPTRQVIGVISTGVLFLIFFTVGLFIK